MKQTIELDENDLRLLVAEKFNVPVEKVKVGAREETVGYPEHKENKAYATFVRETVVETNNPNNKKPAWRD